MGPAAVLLLLLAQAAPAASVEKLRTDDAAERRRAVLELLKAGPAGVEAALAALTAAPSDPGPKVEALVKALASETWTERDRATRELAALGRPAREALAKRSADADPEVAWRVRAALAEIDERAVREERLDELRDGAIADLLGETGDARAAGPLLAVLRDGPAEKRGEAKRRAITALGKLRGVLTAAQAEEAAEAALLALGQGGEVRERAVLIRALGRLRAPSAFRPLAVLATDRSEKDVHLRGEALRALAQSADPAALRAVVEALESEDPWVRGAAAAVLGPLAGAPMEDPAAARAWWSKRFGRAWEKD